MRFVKLSFAWLKNGLAIIKNNTNKTTKKRINKRKQQDENNHNKAIKSSWDGFKFRL